MSHRILIGDVRDTLRQLPDNSVHCCVTSPPYFGLRSYLPDDHPDKALEIGSEPTADEFLATMTAVFREVKRVLRDDGVLFLNLGDSYADSTKWGGRDGGLNALSPRRNGVSPRTRKRRDASVNGQLQNMPHRAAEALRADGWRWRQTIVWAKKSPMPESISGWKWARCKRKTASATNHDDGKNAGHIDRRKVGFNGRWKDPEANAAAWMDCQGCPKCEATDGWILRRGKGRCTTSHEYVFVLSKSDQYFWDIEASKEPDAGTARNRGNGLAGRERNNDGFSSAVAGLVSHRNPRSVWTLSSEPTREKHFAAFPSELVRRCLVAGVSSAGCCPDCGAPWAPMVVAHRTATRPGSGSKVHGAGGSRETGNRDPGRHVTSTECLGYRQTCGCPTHSPRPCTVLDPFSGLGTTGQTAVFLGHDYIGCELSAEYAAISERRIATTPRWALRQQASVTTSKMMPLPGQGVLFE